LRIAVSFKRAHTAFELGNVSRPRKVLIPALSFGALEPVANVLEKEGKEHDDLLNIASGLTPDGGVDEIRFVWRMDAQRSADG
jgi:hypothetical protein